VLSAIDHPILEIVMIRRKDNNELALPGVSVWIVPCMRTFAFGNARLGGVVFLNWFLFE
jgi:hypothetical protein